MIELVKDFDKDVYQSLLEDLDNNLTDENLDDWISNYETEGRYGIGVFLRDYINQKEAINIDIDDPDGTFIGISAGAPWEFDPKLRTMTELDFNNMLNKYVCMITDDALSIQLISQHSSPDKIRRGMRPFHLLYWFWINFSTTSRLISPILKQYKYLTRYGRMDN